MLEGLKASAPAKLVEKRSFSGSGGTVYQAQFQGYGFTTWVMTDRDYNDSLPPIGTVGQLTVELDPQKDGSFKLVRPKFVVESAAGSSSATRATQRTPAGV